MIDQAEIHYKCISCNLEERKIAINLLKVNFEKLPNKKQAWEDLLRLTSDENSVAQGMAITALETVFAFMPDKDQAWEGLHILISNGDSDIRCLVTEVIGSIFEYLPCKREVWEDLHKLTSDDNHRVRNQTVLALETAFRFIPEKEEAWEDLVKLTSDEESWVRWNSADALKTALHYAPHKEKVLKDLQRLASDIDYWVKSEAILAQGTVFQYEPEKKKAWNELCRLASDKNSDVRNAATTALGTSFLYVPDKKQAWEDLHKLTFDENSDVRNGAAWALGTAFQYIPDIKQAWEDLHRLTLDEESWVRNGATWAIGDAFQYLPNKQPACDDLHRLSSDEDDDVRIIACHYLGRVSVYKASQSSSEEEYLKELENSIIFFEDSYEENSDNNPSGFCLPFYRSFYTIIRAEKQHAKDEVEKYLEEARNAIKGSENKKLLLEAVENLARALEEVQNLKNMDLKAKKGELGFYRKYCEQAAELMKNTEEITPFATATMRKGLPILDRKLKSLLEEIKEKAITACRESQGTATAEIACAVSREVQKWEIGSQEEMTLKVEDIAYLLKTKVANLLENEYVLNKIEAMRHERDLTKQYEALIFVIGQIPTVKVVSEYELDHKLHKLDLVYDKTVIIEDKLSCISYDIFKIKLNSHNVISSLDAMKKEMEKLNEIKILNPSSLEKMNSVQVNKLNYLNKDILERLKEIRTLIDDLPKNNETQKIIDSLNELRQSDSNMLLQRSSEITSLIGFVIQVIQLYLQYKPA